MTQDDIAWVRQAIFKPTRRRNWLHAVGLPLLGATPFFVLAYCAACVLGGN